ncbi:MAG: cytochrome c3 family protein [Pseudomonadota bacterium]
MKLLLVTLRKRAGSDDVSRRETILDGAEFKVGRAVSSEINLSDIDIDYHHATVRIDGGQVRMSAESEGGISAQSGRVNEANLSAGGSVAIGRYTFTAEPGRDGADAVMVLEEAPAAPVASGAKRKGKRDLEQVLPSRRLLGWVFSLAVIGIFVVWPMTDVLQRPGMPGGPAVNTSEIKLVDGMARKDLPKPSPMEIAWSSGPLSDVHKLIENDCAACHVSPFEMTADNACLSCHANTQNHADVQTHPAVSLDNTRCGSCHKEHNGGASPVETAITECTNCHQDIKTVSAKSELENITSFETQHPIFQLAVITGVEQDESGEPMASVSRTRFNPDQPPVEKSGLKFPHSKHLVEGGMKSPNGRVQLQCASCHQLEAGGALMRPIDMERDCGGCHRMEFDAAGLKRPLPHAEEDEIARVIETYFLAAAMEGGVTSAAAPPAVKRKRKKRITLEELEQQQQQTQQAVAQLSDSDRGLTIEWARKETLVQMDALFGVRLCGTCHEAQKFPDEKGEERWKVLPAVLQRHWMPKARFDHTPHLSMDCTGCHNAPESAKSEDVLMPAMDVCRDCHVDAQQTAGADCVSCHEYHVPGREPMSPAHAELYQARADARQRAPKTVAQK